MTREENNETTTIEFNENEKTILTIMFKNIYSIVSAQNGYLDLEYGTFNNNDLFDLKEKICPDIDYC